MNTIENLRNRIAYGEPHMKKLSELSVKEIIDKVEKIWEISCSNFPGISPEIKKDENRKITITYDSNLSIENIIIKWSYYNSISIELSAMGLIAIYEPEHSYSSKILDLSWALIDPFFFK